MFKDYDINDDPYYLYICALLTEREKEFIDKQRWERLINADSTKDFLKVLQETHYSKYTNMIEKTGNLESAMTEEHTSIMNLLRGFLKKEHEPLKEFYLLRLDMQNIKIIMKACITEKDFSDIFHAFSYSYQDLKEAYESGKYDKIDKETQEILNYAKHTIDLEKNQRTRELLLERFYLNKIYEHFSSMGSEMLIDLLKHTIDMYNIKNIYRVKLLKDKIPYDAFLYENGFLEKRELIKYEKESTDYFIQSIEKTPYLKMIFQGTHMFQQKNTFSAFERNEDEFVLNFFEQVKYSVSNLEKLVYFALRKRIEMKNLNIALIGATYSIDKERIRNRILAL